MQRVLPGALTDPTPIRFDHVELPFQPKPCHCIRRQRTAPASIGVDTRLKLEEITLPGPVVPENSIRRDWRGEAESAHHAM
jgi:hypothetical protein